MSTEVRRDERLLIDGKQVDAMDEDDRAVEIAHRSA